MKCYKLIFALILSGSIFATGCDSTYDADSYYLEDPIPEINVVEIDEGNVLDSENEAAENEAAENEASENEAAENEAAENEAAENEAAEKAAAEKAAAEKAAAEKAAAEKAAAEKAAAEKAAAEKAAADKEAAEKAAREKEAAKYKIKLIDFSGTLYRNEIVTITIQGKPNTEYNLDVYYKSGKSKAKGLGKTTSDSDGIATWTFKVGGRTTEDYTPEMVFTGNGESVTVEFLVADND